MLWFNLRKKQKVYWQEDLNTSYVMVQSVNDYNGKIAITFKYILCYGSMPANMPFLNFNNTTFY